MPIFLVILGVMGIGAAVALKSRSSGLGQGVQPALHLDDGRISDTEFGVLNGGTYLIGVFFPTATTPAQSVGNAMQAFLQTFDQGVQIQNPRAGLAGALGPNAGNAAVALATFSRNVVIPVGVPTVSGQEVIGITSAPNGAPLPGDANTLAITIPPTLQLPA